MDLLGLMYANDMDKKDQRIKELERETESLRARNKILENAAKAALVWWDDLETDLEDLALTNSIMELLRAAIYPSDDQAGVEEAE